MAKRAKTPKKKSTRSKTTKKTPAQDQNMFMIGFVVVLVLVAAYALLMNTLA